MTTIIVSYYTSRSEDATGSGFHPCDKSDKIYCSFLGPSWCKKKVDPEKKVSLWFILTVGEQCSTSNEGEIYYS